MSAPEPNPVWRRPVVGVMGSGTAAHEERALPLGRWLAGAGVHLLTGGGEGVMAAVSRAFHDSSGRAGAVLGVLPGDPDSGRAPAGYPNPWVELAIRTHLPLSGARGTEPLSRNHLNVLCADVVVALPGGPGTASEVRLAQRYGRPIVAFVTSPREIPDLPGTVPLAATLDEVVAFVTDALRDRLGTRSEG